MNLRLPLHDVQRAFVDSDATFTSFVGGRGAGKSHAAAAKLMLCSLSHKGLYGMYAPTYPLLHDTIERSFLSIARPVIAKRIVGHIEMINGSEILCRSLDEPERARGPSLRGAVVDEASLCTREAFEILIGSLRYEGEQGWLSCAFTPKGPRHWTAEVFNSDQYPDAEMFTCSTTRNPFLPESFADTLRRRYTNKFAEQEIEGRFVDLSGSLCKREWFGILEVRPHCEKVVRAWDFAATADTGNNDPDWTVGVLMGKHEQGWCVLDVVRERVAGGSVLSIVKATAAQDGQAVPIVIEREPGSSGKIAASFFTRELAGYNVSQVAPSSDKVTRAMPFLAQAEAGSISIYRGSWLRDYLDELSSFPDGGHDDQIDATAHAFNNLASVGAQLSFALT